MRMPSNGGDEDDAGMAPLSEINVTPMVDVMLVLLIIFMVTAPLMMSGVPLQLPKTAATAIRKPQDPIILSLDREGRMFLGADPITADALPGRLRTMAQAAPDQIVYVRGDRALRYGRVMEVMGVVSASGFARVSLLAEQAPAPR